MESEVRTRHTPPLDRFARGGDGLSKRSSRTLCWSLWCARIALATAFFSAVADRLGIWGPVEAIGVDWGSMERFSQDVRALNPWLPDTTVLPLAWIVTGLEALLGVALLTGPFVRLAAFASAALLTAFGATMGLFLTPKLPLNYSVFTAAACALLVGCSYRSRP